MHSNLRIASLLVSPIAPKHTVRTVVLSASPLGTEGVYMIDIPMNLGDVIVSCTIEGGDSSRLRLFVDYGYGMSELHHSVIQTALPIFLMDTYSIKVQCIPSEKVEAIQVRVVYLIISLAYKSYIRSVISGKDLTFPNP